MEEDTVSVVALAFIGEFLALTAFFLEPFWAVDSSDIGETDCALPTDFLCTFLLNCFAAEWDLEIVDTFIFLGDVPALRLEESITEDGVFFFWGEAVDFRFLIWVSFSDVELKTSLAASENCNSPSSLNVMLPCNTDSKHN